MRAYLDENGLMALELLSSYGHLRALDRMDAYFPSALQHIAQLQAIRTGLTKMERLDKLYLVFQKMIKRARRSEEDYENYAIMLADKGADRTISEIRAAHPKTASIVVCGMLGVHLRGKTWSDKLGLAIDIAELSTGPLTIQLADEIISEIMDGADVIDELFRGFSTCADAWKVFVLLTSGRLSSPPKYMSPQIKRLNTLFMHLDLKKTRGVLLGRISKGLASTQKLSQDGREADRNAFLNLVRDLSEPTGIYGGARMAEAVVLRTKSLLGEDGGDLPTETAIRQAVYLMPSQAGRLGLLLDLAASDLGHKFDNIVRQQLLHLLDALKSIFDLFPEDVKKEYHVQELDRLRERLSLSTLPEKFQGVISVSFDKLMEEKPVKSEATDSPKPDAPVKRIVKGETDEAFLEKDAVLFEEDDRGDEAYLVVQGSVEIFRMYDGKKRSLAVVGVGEIIGEMALVDNQPRMASATAVEDTILVCISKDNLQVRINDLAEKDTVMHLLLRTLVRRLRGLARNTE
ncbi:MAG: cyclic nucleotide-binding domain-containing protein, partial [Magnetovibrio sp.]|nr:cyclic nucleotide-binding domain-containing protein [Magnetovibrio sp.]